MNAFHFKARQQLKRSRDWLQYRMLPRPQAQTIGATFGTGHLLLTPDDLGSIGDAAMVRSVTDHFSPGEVDVSRWNKSTRVHYPSTGKYVDVATLKGSLAEKSLTPYQRVGCLGADVMDGLYSYVDSSFRLRLLGLAAGMGLDARLYGFSFNAKPHPTVALEFKKLHRDVRIFVRDPVSLQRLSAVTDRPLVQVADLAFLVAPTETHADTCAAVQWIKRERQRGQQVLGINVHPMFSFEHGNGITEGMLTALGRILSEHPSMSFILIPHDYRPTFGDLATLSTLHASLREKHGQRLLLVNSIDDPAEIKGLVGHLDGVLTGRMHLAIAALGQGIPVAAITYQGKFEGLLQHFHLSQACTVPPPEVANHASLQRFFTRWISGLEQSRQEVVARLPAVKSLAKLNFS